MNWLNYSNSIQDYINNANFIVSQNYNTDYLDVNETISKLSYLTHDYFRYYGKFPSKIAKYIIEYVFSQKRVSPDSDFIFDNYNGSGTSMVESKIAGFESAGIDINPFGVLASNVKTKNLDITILNRYFEDITTKIMSLHFSEKQEDLFTLDNTNSNDLSEILNSSKQIRINYPDVDKWFEDDVILALSAIKYFLLQMPPSEYREFFLLGFFSIIRRVSKAHDAEVRPHVNLKKRKRDVFDAYKKKISEMISTMHEWNHITDKRVQSCAFLCDNSDNEKVTGIISSLKERYNKDLGLVISHPPYLNCFDYIPVYKLKFMWANGVEEIFGQMTYKEIKDEEIKSYPASNDSFVNNYFRHNMSAYKIIYDNLKSGGYCCVVIGDCTINKELFSVHKILIKMMEGIGFSVDKITYRSTAYGMGRYAYNHRADYNDKAGGKQDAILFFVKR